VIATFSRDYQPSAQWLRRARHDVAEFATYCGFGTDRTADIVLAVGEAVANTVEHSGSPRDFSIKCEFDGTRLLLRVEDHGSGFTPSLRPVIREKLQPRGLGIYLMNKLMDAAEFSFKPGDGTILTLVKRLAA
jgi:anti-sigma regulatory factor (Ser/Thr protein kinase)